MTDADEVKNRLNIVDVVGERVQLKQAGRHFKGLCPFHQEKTPSFIVSPQRQSFHCFGCGKGGSVIDFVMEYEHVDFVEALEQLAERAGVTLTKRTGVSSEQKLKESIYTVNQLACEFYQYMLTRHSLGEKALLYLKKRGVSDKSIKTFGLGYSPNSWDALSLFLKKKKYDEKLLAQAGLTVRGNHGYYDRFRGRVMFPLRDHRGNTVGFSGRVLDPTVKEAKYINTSETPAYSKSNVLYGLDVTKSAIAKKGEALCMEGEFDLISSFQEGISNVVAIKGSALTEGHVHLLRRFAKTVIFCLDSDMAGDAAVRRGIDVVEQAGLEIQAVVIPSGKDPDEAVRSDPVGFKKAISSAVPIYDFFLESVRKRYDLASASGKKRASEEIVPLLFRMTNAIVRGHYIKMFARLLGVSEEYINEEVRKVKSPLVRDVGKEKEPASHVPTRREKIELYLLSLLLQGETLSLWQEMTGVIASDDFSLPEVKRLMEYIGEYADNHREFDIQQFAQTIPSELVPCLDEAYLWDVSGISQDPHQYQVEWQKTMRELRLEIIKQKISDVSGHARLSEDAVLQEELSQLSKQRSALEKITIV